MNQSISHLLHEFLANMLETYVWLRSFWSQVSKSLGQSLYASTLNSQTHLLSFSRKPSLRSNVLVSLIGMRWPSTTLVTLSLPNILILLNGSCTCCLWGVLYLSSPLTTESETSFLLVREFDLADSLESIDLSKLKRLLLKRLHFGGGVRSISFFMMSEMSFVLGDDSYSSFCSWMESFWLMPNKILSHTLVSRPLIHS